MVSRSLLLHLQYVPQSLFLVRSSLTSAVGANSVAIVYLIDSYPQRASSLLIIICSFRGFLSFGLTYPLDDMLDAVGYDGLFGIYSGLTALMGVLTVMIFVWGKKIREITGKYAFLEDRRD